MDSFERQRARVMWNCHVSYYFSIFNWVKRGGVSSPVMFNLYNFFKAVWYRPSYKWNVYGCSRIRTAILH